LASDDYKEENKLKAKAKRESQTETADKPADDSRQLFHFKIILGKAEREKETSRDRDRDRDGGNEWYLVGFSPLFLFAPLWEPLASV